MNTYEKHRGGGVLLLTRNPRNVRLLPVGGYHAVVNYRPSTSLRQRRAAGELAQRGVPYILKVGDADPAGVEAVAGEIAQKRKERHALAERGILLRILAKRNQVQDLILLFRLAFHQDAA